MIDENEKPEDVEETPEADAEDAPERDPAPEAEAPAEAEAPEEAEAGEPEAEEPEEEESAEEPEPVAAPAATKDEPAAAPKRRRERPSGEAPVVRAHARYVRTSARKARLVCDHLRGKTVEEARAILATTNRAVAEDWTKLLESAVANAEHNHELLGDDLRIQAIYADEGPTLRRYRPRAMGRATKIRKRTSHLTIALTPKE